jgi:hypothetical protein
MSKNEVVGVDPDLEALLPLILSLDLTDPPAARTAVVGGPMIEGMNVVDRMLCADPDVSMRFYCPDADRDASAWLRGGWVTGDDVDTGRPMAFEVAAETGDEAPV